MCDVRVTDRFTCKELRERLETNNYTDAAKWVKMIWTCFKKGQE